MPQNFLACDREQELLLPPSLREWLPENHLAWCVIDAVGEFDLSAFYAAYRADGWGRAAHEPAMMVALFVYAYAVGIRSSRGIERHCRDDVAFRVICANQAPDHATIARSASSAAIDAGARSTTGPPARAFPRTPRRPRVCATASARSSTVPALGRKPRLRSAAGHETAGSARDSVIAAA